VVIGANDDLVTPEVVTARSLEVPAAARQGSVTGLGAFAAAGAAVLCLAFSSKLSSETFTPKFAVLLLFAAVGIVPLARLVMGRSPLRWAARAAVAFLAVALVSALLSPSPNIGFFGLYLWGTGWLFWLGAAGAFAIGASLGPNDRKWLFAGLLIGALGNALIAIFQIASNVETGALALFDQTQAAATLGNPIHLEALLLGALALILGRACRSPLRWGAVVLILAVGLEFTFERFALAILALLIVYALYSHGVRRGGIFALLVAGGYAIAFLSGGSGLGSRVASGTGETTFGTRLRIWWEGAHYVLHHPLLGAGPGQLRTAMDSAATLSFFQHVLAGKILTDGHDIFVEVGVTTGLLGLACFAVWLFGGARTAGGCGFLGFAAAMFAVELVEPINIAVLPLAFLGLGAATAVRLMPGGPPGPEAHGVHGGQADLVPTRGRARAPYAGIVTAVAVSIALFVGATMVGGDYLMFRGTNYAVGQPYNLGLAKDADRLLPYWPDPALEVAQIEAYDSTSGKPDSPALLVDSRNWTVVALDRDSRYPRIWTLLGGADVELKEYGLAHADYVHALSLDRWYTQALAGLGQLAAMQRNWTQAARWYGLALETAVKDPTESVPLEGLLKGAEQNAKKASR